MIVRFSLIALLLTACTGAPSPDVTPPANADTTQAQVTYVCPMHPDVTSTDPKTKCSKCGMDLVKQEDHGHDGKAHEGHGH